MNQNHGKSGWILKTGMWVCGILAAVCLVYGVVEWVRGNDALSNTALKNTDPLAKLGNFGSFLQGTVASVWALAGVFLFVLAYLGQQQELRLQREQLAAQEKQLKEQLETMKKQSFEDSFFQLLNLQRELQAQIETITLVRDNSGIVVTPKAIHGKDCFQVFRETLKTHYNGRKVAPAILAGQLVKEPDPLPTEKTLAIESYKQLYSNHQQQLAHYFRNLYHIIKFVATSEMKDKRRYTSLVRAQLSAYELAVLFYNCQGPYGDGFKKYVEQFGLMEHLDRQLLLNPSHMDDKDFYADSAYE